MSRKTRQKQAEIKAKRAADKLAWIENEARRLAKAMVRTAIRGAGVRVDTFNMAQLAEDILEVRGRELRRQARENLKRQKAAVGCDNLSH